MNTSWREILRAHWRASRFAAFLDGVDVALPTGETVNLKIERVYSPPSAKLFRILPHTFITEMRAGNFREVGCAEAAHPLIALQKSISEAVERSLFRVLKGSPIGTNTTNGWAAHVSQKHAENAALLELLERDAVLVHALREIPFLRIQRETLPDWLFAWERRELGHTIFNCLHVLLSTAGHYPSLSVAFVGDSGKGVIAHASAKTLEHALIRALAEACRLGRIALSGHFNECARELFSNADDISSTGPCEQAVAYSGDKPLPEWIFGDSIEWPSAFVRWNHHLARFDADPISYDFVPVLESPLAVGYCKSADVQGLFFGRTHDAARRGEINRKRLGNSGERLSNLPHFVA